MKTLLVLFVFSVSFFISGFSQSENFYSESGGELIFSFADVEKNGESVNTPLRFTLFLHMTKLYHYNINSFSGFYSGLSLRNIGYITKENEIKTKRRTYSAGIPLALKIGDMEKDLYVFGGATYELFFHYKQKKFVDGNKSKFSEWFSDRTKRFAPSFFAGIHLPGGLSLKFKYYPQDFLNKDFKGKDFGEEVDYANYNRTNLFYIGLAYYIRPQKIIENFGKNSREARYAYLEN